MARLTKWIVYVDKETQKKASSLFDAVFAHFIKKDMDVAKRKLFMSQFLKASTEERQLALIDAWVMVRDIEAFPFRKGNEKSEPDTAPVEDDADEDTGTEEEVPVDDGSDNQPD